VRHRRGHVQLHRRGPARLHDRALPRPRRQRRRLEHPIGPRGGEDARAGPAAAAVATVAAPAAPFTAAGAAAGRRQSNPWRLDVWLLRAPAHGSRVCLAARERCASNRLIALRQFRPFETGGLFQILVSLWGGSVLLQPQRHGSACAHDRVLGGARLPVCHHGSSTHSDRTQRLGAWANHWRSSARHSHPNRRVRGVPVAAAAATTAAAPATAALLPARGGSMSVARSKFVIDTRPTRTRRNTHDAPNNQRSRGHQRGENTKRAEDGGRKRRPGHVVVARGWVAIRRQTRSL